MKTLLFTIEYKPAQGGVVNYYKNLVKFWPESNSISVLARDYLKKTFKQFFYFRDLYREYKKDKFDYILVGQILPLGTITYFFSKIFKIKYAVFIHGMEIGQAFKSSKQKILFKKILRQAHKIIIPNNFTANLVEKLDGNLKNKIIIVNPGVETRPEINHGEILNFKKQYNLAGKTILFSLGRLVKRKGFDMVIKSLEKLPFSDLEKIIYIIAGAGKDEDYLRDLVSKNPKLKEKILFLGEIRDSEKWSWLDLCDIFIMPARNINGDFEGFGIVYLEANLSQKPVIAGNAGGVPEAVINGLNGLLVDPNNEMAISTAISQLVNDRELRIKLGKQGYDRATKNFSWQNKIQEIFQQINLK